MKKLPWDEEADAAGIVSALLHGVAEQVDPGGGAVQLHDLDVVLPDGSMIAVEVTRHTVPASLRVLAEVDKRDWHFPDLQGVWVVDMIADFDFKQLHRRVAGLLHELELAGIESLTLRSFLFDETIPDDYLPDDEREARQGLTRSGAFDAGKQLFGLGARLVYRIREADPGGGEVIVGEAGQGGSTGPSVIVELIERHASMQDNLRKLAAASDRAERHLFVWVEASQHAAVAAINGARILPDGAGLPDHAPQLPEAVDAVWVVTGFEPASILQYHRLLGWRDLGSWRRPT